ncbi:MAG: HPP family protein [Alphaproteobacteria bacterium]|jgi:acetoin utilization protein AcuB
MKRYTKMPSVGAVMTSFPYFVNSDDTLPKIERLMDEHNIRHVPVLKKRRVVGIVSERDLHHFIKRSAPVEEKARTKAGDVMVADPYVVQFSAPLNEVVAEMAKRHVGSAIVVRRGSLAGILSGIDVCRILAEYLEWRFSSRSGNDAA